MTLDEYVRKLQMLQSQGHGSKEVIDELTELVGNPEEIEGDIVICAMA